MITSIAGDKAAKPIIATMATAEHVRFYQQLQHRIASQGRASNFTQAGRDVDTGKVADEQWSKMSYSQKKEYADRASSPGNRR